MTDQNLLDLLARAFEALDHPEVVRATRFSHPGQSGVRVWFSDGSSGLATSYGAPTATGGATHAR